MKKIATLGAALAAAILITNSSAADVDSGALDLSGFKAAEGAEFVEVNINSNLIAMVTNFAGKHEPEVADVLKGLKSIQVNVLGLNDSNRDSVEDRISSIRSKLTDASWDRVVTVQKENEDVGIFMKTRGPEAVEGLVVTVLKGGKEAVIVNIVGDIRPEKLATVGERFNIEPLKHLPGKAEQAKAE